MASVKIIGLWRQHSEEGTYTVNREGIHEEWGRCRSRKSANGWPRLRDMIVKVYEYLRYSQG